MGVVVAAAGSLLGSYAAKAIMGEKAPLEVDTSIPGVTQAVVQKKTKANDAINVAQVDPSGAINYFKQAATSYEDKAMKGLNVYADYMQKAIDSTVQYSDAAKTALSGMIVSGNTANAEYMKMLGLSPPSQVQTSGILDTVKNLGYEDLQAKMIANENITDATQRAEAKQAVINELNARGANTLSTANNELTTAQAALAKLGPPPAKPAGTDLSLGPGAGGSVSGILTSAEANAYKKATDDYYATKSQLEQSVAAAQLKIAGATDSQKQALALATQYGSMYGATKETGYTGAEARAKLAATPGYQFALETGNQAVQRAAAAGGLLGSGNTLAAVSQFSQGLADQTYQGYLNNLRPLIESGNQGSTAAANIGVNTGNSISQLYGNGATAALNAYSNIGQAYSNAYSNAGQVTYNAAQYNATAQNAALTAKRQQDANAQQNAQQNALQAGQLQLQNAQFNYTVAQNQQGGQAAYAKSAGTYSAGAGTGYPYYNQSTGKWSI